jgi:predicted small lipoprotein YifL
LKHSTYKVAVAAATMGLAAGCGLKGPLTMPERSSNIVIRGPTGEVVDGATSPTPPAAGEAPGTTTTPAPASPAGDAPASPPTGTPPAVKKPAADPDRMPPPPLPGGNPGSMLGG